MSRGPLGEMSALSSTDHPSGTSSAQPAAPASLHLTPTRREEKVARCRMVQKDFYMFYHLGLGIEMAESSQLVGM